MVSPVRWLTDTQYEQASTGERALAWADHHASLKVREIGANRGPWVQRFLASVGLGPGYPWCAAFVSFNFEKAGEKGFGPAKGRAAVRNWDAWAQKQGLVLAGPRHAHRGDLFYWLKDGKGHIGHVRRVYRNGDHWWIDTIEGNTNAGGSREGDGVYKRTRQWTRDIKFILVR